MTSKKFNRLATVIFYVLGMLFVGVMFISWNDADIPPAAEPISAAVESIAKQEKAIPLPINDREPQNFAQPTIKSESSNN